MYQSIGNGERGVPHLPQNTMAILVAFHAELVVHPSSHPASGFAKYWLWLSLRSLALLDLSSLCSLVRPWHYERMAQFLHSIPECIEVGKVLRHRLLYNLLRENHEAPLARQIVGRDVEWNSLQPAYLESEAKDLNWLGVRERLYHFGSTRNPLCLVGCGLEETVAHVFWFCPCARSFWELVKKWTGESLMVPWNEGMVRFGDGLKALKPRKYEIIWTIVSEGKRALWGWRGKCLRVQNPNQELGSVFLIFLSRIRVMEKKRRTQQTKGIRESPTQDH